MENKSHAFAAGLFTIVLSLVIVATIFWFRRDTTVRVPYDVVTTGAVTGLAANAAVRYRGMPVGRVQRIAFDPARPGDIVIRILVDQATPITHATEASLGLQGVTGMAFLQLDERGGHARPGDDDRRPLATSARQVAVIPMHAGVFEQLQHRGEALLGQMEALTASLGKLTDADARRQYLATAASIQHAADGIGQLARRAGPAVDRLPRTLAQLDQTLASTNRLVANLNRPDGPLIGNLNRIGRVAEHASATLDDMSARVAYETLPRVDALADDVRTASRSIARVADTVGDHPRSLLFGAPAAAPGPGEPGFAWPAAGTERESK
ncbi:MlaD family protein [Robbsia sp. Bb-Pol-6]|uniref:MlaD family protein n=1 Tax=Robbsia betulipollinis TaxID=2981849 RepID=A0ABT3ZR96_9BURK|nr:MlaD family protein [Robbsia betulipollinis]MCY0389084.1 MlaD family protein [Robbsia betulipollinis]